MPLTATQLVEQWHVEHVQALNKQEYHWGKNLDWHTAALIAERIDEANAPEPKSCEIVTGDAYCTLQAGHEGGCHIVTDD